MIMICKFLPNDTEADQPATYGHIAVGDYRGVLRLLLV